MLPLNGDTGDRSLKVRCEFGKVHETSVKSKSVSTSEQGNHSSSSKSSDVPNVAAVHTTAFANGNGSYSNGKAKAAGIVLPRSRDASDLSQSQANGTANGLPSS